ncbi:MAG TPA: retropepsin-like aspartic protease [Stellaceae bacterium]|nr:retropepsin-like aspartic protease [Stellaceae bacterium]
MARAELTYPPGRYPTTDKRDLLILCGPTLRIDIGLDRNYDSTVPEIVPRLALRQAQALVDTGSTCSYIDSSVARRLGLPEIDKEAVATALGGRQTVTTYMAQVHVPALAVTLIGPFGGLDLAPLDVVAVLGREFLMHWKMSYDGTSGVVIIES